MKLHEAIQEIIDSNHFNKEMRRDSWTHGDSLQIVDESGYMNGQLYWKISGKRAGLFFVEDFLANDWCVE